MNEPYFVIGLQALRLLLLPDEDCLRPLHDCLCRCRCRRGKRRFFRKTRIMLSFRFESVVWRWISKCCLWDWGGTWNVRVENGEWRMGVRSSSEQILDFSEANIVDTQCLVP